MRIPQGDDTLHKLFRVQALKVSSRREEIAVGSITVVNDISMEPMIINSSFYSNESIGI